MSLNKAPLITVAIPAYKAKYLKVAIQSVLNQTFNDYELIIVNDNSPEDLDEIVKSFTDERIKYYKNEINLGKESVVKSWNKCLEYASGDFFVIFSDDDIYESDFIEKMYNLLSSWPKVNIVHCRVRIIDGNNETIEYSPSCPEYENIIDFMWHRLKGMRSQYAPDFMVKTAKLKAIGGFIDFPLAWGSDDATWFKLAKDNGIVYLNKPLCNWRLSNLNISKAGSTELKINAYIVYDKWANDFINTIDVVDAESRFQINQIKKLLYAWKKNKFVDILTSTAGYGFLSLFKIFQNWLRFRNTYQFDSGILKRAISSKLKKILFV
jgi:glycosyltransferase involved in cell wall biosynthesis